MWSRPAVWSQVSTVHAMCMHCACTAHALRVHCACLYHQVSTDSNHFGSVDVESVQARVAAKLWPLNEAGLVR